MVVGMDEMGRQPRPSRLTPAQVLGGILATGGVAIAVAGGVAGRAALGGWGLTFVGLALAFQTTSTVARIGGAFIVSLVVIGVLGRALRDTDESGTTTPAEEPHAVAANTPSPVPNVAAPPWTLFKTDDGMTSMYVQRSRSILVEEDIDEPQLQRLLRSIYTELRREALDAAPSSKKVFVYAYPTEARAAAGNEWIGMIGEIGEGGLPAEPEVQIRLGGAMLRPTAAEEAVYDDLQQRLAAAAMRSPDLNEDAVMRAVARKHQITVDELDALHIRMMTHRSGR